MSEQAEADYAVIEIRGDVDRPADEVWAVVGGFFDLDKWLGVPCIAHSGDGGIGSVRRIGDAVVEPMIAATQYSYSYAQTEGPMAPFCYHGTVACEGRGEARTMIVYTLVYDQSSMDAGKRASERARIEARFGGAVEAMKRAVLI
ncbi:MAG: polyketide cyclase [Parvibaculum sp.]|nr:polyketide cyclase [Parvibaculum sp.]